MSPSRGPQPLPAHSGRLRNGRVEAELVESYVRHPRNVTERPERRRRVFETGRFETLARARLWAAARLLEVEAVGMHAEPSVRFTGYAAARGWRSQDLGELSLEEARAEAGHGPGWALEDDLATPDNERNHR